MTSPTLHTLLHTIVDYAGLFPPAGLAMDTAVANYAAYRRSPHAWMLGRFVAPVSRLDEMSAAMRALGEAENGHPWRVSALVGEDVEGEVTKASAFNAGHRGALIDALEVKASSVDGVRRIAAAVPQEMKTYVEIPVTADPGELVGAIAAAKLRAKIRTGGVTPEAFPTVEAVAAFLRACYAASVPFKATAGLHHPVRSERALTYAADAPRGMMHGFLNVFLAAAFHYNGLTIRDARDLIAATRLDDVVMDGDRVSWREYVVSLTELATVRRRLAIAFGSCSFREPIDDLIALGMLS